MAAGSARCCSRASVAVCTFVGEVASNSAVVLVAVLAVASFGAGMFIALGVPTYVVALTGRSTITVVSSAPADAAHALERAALAFAGGLVAIALVPVPWRAHAHLPERRAIARVYPLAAWVRDPNTDDRRPTREAHTKARQALDASAGSTAVPSPSVEAFRVLLDEADRTYRDLVSLRSARQRVEPVDRPSGVPSTSAAALPRRRSSQSRKRSNPRVGTLTPARSATASTSPSPRSDELAADRAAGEVLPANELEEMLRRGASVRGFRGAIDLATSWQGEGPPPDPVRHARPRRAELGVRRPGPILRANLTLRSSAFRTRSASV